MKFNKRVAKSIIILLILIVSTIVQVAYLSLYNGNIDNEAQNTDQNFLNNDHPEKNPIHTSSNSPPGANYFKYYKIITIDSDKVQGGEDLVDFPLLVSILDSELHDKVQADGDDIAFSNGTHWLDHEIESFNQNYNPVDAKLVAWVRIPSLSTSVDTKIYMYYGNSTVGPQENPSGVWKNNYVGVWHLNETSSNALDSTSYGTYGTPSGGVTQGVIGKIDGSYDFDGVNDQVSFGDPLDGHLDFDTDSFTVSFWINIDASTSYYQLPIYKGATTSDDRGYDFETNQAGDNLQFGISDGDEVVRTWGIEVDFDTWMYVTGIVDRDVPEIRLYKDDTVIDAGTAITTVGSINNFNAFVISPSVYSIDGMLDEIRVSNGTRSAGWIATEYNNQKNPNTFYTISGRYELNPPNPEDFKYYKVITIDNDKVEGTGSHINFPLLISILDSDLHDKVQADGDDIAFYNGTIWLDHEIEMFIKNYNPTQAKLVAWVKIPSLSTLMDTVIFMYYGNSTMDSRQNPTGVWDSNYLGLWHLSEDPTGTIYDSTSNNYDATSYGSMTSGDQVSGQIDGALDFDGTNDYISWTTTISQTIGTYSWWMYAHSVIGERNYIADDAYRRRISLWDDVVKIETDTEAEYFDFDQSSISANTWTYVVFLREGDVGNLYVDGSHIQQVTVTGADTITVSCIGGTSDNARMVDGIIDEVRISNIERSADWIATEYNNQYQPSSFYSVSERFETDPISPVNFNFYKEITIDHTKISGINTLANFPVLISILDEDLHDDVQPDGDDIAFFKDGQWLNHQIELFNQSYSGTHAQLIAWVQIPYLFSVKDTNFFMYYSNLTMTSRQNPTGVWDSHYKGVWHLNENPSGTPPQIKDSTSPYSNGSTYGIMTPSDQIPGIIDGSLNLDGSNDYIDFGNPLELRITGAITVEAWFKADFVGNDYLVNKMGSDGSRGWDISFDDGVAPNGWVMFRYSIDGSIVKSVGWESVTAGKWYHVVGVFKPDQYASFYLNGTEVDTDTTGIPSSQYDPSVNVRIARRSDGFGSYFNGTLDEVRISDGARSSDWIATEYNNQFDPDSFYFIGTEQEAKEIITLDAQINAIDYDGNLIPNVNISIIQDDVIIKSGLTDSQGSVLFTNISSGDYNFTATITSDDENFVEIVNKTSKAISIENIFQIINLTCNIGSNFFKVIDIEGNPVDSGYILVGNDSNILRNCSIDENGNARFWWVNKTPYEYNYTVRYRDNNFNPNVIDLASDDILGPNAPNSPIIINVNLTTVNFTIFGQVYGKIVSGAKLLLKRSDNGVSIVNLTTNQYGKATLRWVNSSGLSPGKIVNYSLQIDFFGYVKFNVTTDGPLEYLIYNFTVNGKYAYIFILNLNPDEYQTEIVSLNPSDYNEVEWGTQLKVRMEFTVTRVATGSPIPLGPTYADSPSYQVLLGSTVVRSESMSIEENYNGRHYAVIDTTQLESDKYYLIIISAQKSGFTLPSDLILQLSVLKNNIILNQSENEELSTEVYWLENANMEVQPYGEISEDMFLEDNIFKESVSGDYIFEFSIPDLNTDWNLTKIVFNVEGVTFGEKEEDINITITDDDYGTQYTWTEFNETHEWYGEFANNGTWNDLTIILNERSYKGNNTFNFRIEGTFLGTFDVTADATFTRDKINVDYYKSNITNYIIIPSDGNGWAIKNITFEIKNCRNLSGTPVNPADVIKNITTNEDYVADYFYDTAVGTGKLSINDTIIYPINNQFLFYIGNNTPIIFDVVIKIEYIQEFYENPNLESIISTKTIRNFNNLINIFQISPVEEGWIDNGANLIFTAINNATHYFYPSDLAMNITINGQKFSVSDSLKGYGTFSLDKILNFDKDKIYTAIIETNQLVNFTLSFKIECLRTVIYETTGTIIYNLTLDIHGTVQYNESLRCYQQTINTSSLNAGIYNVRFTVVKDHYNSDTLDLGLKVQERLTLISGSSVNIDLYPSIYVEDAINYTLSYTDYRLSTNILNLDSQSYTLSKIGTRDQSVVYGSGDLYLNSENEYVLDINTETLQVGRYSIWITLEKQNYESKQAVIFLTVNEREIDYDLGDMFEEKQTSVVKGETITLSIELSDPTKGDIPLKGATVILEISDDDLEFEEVEDGVYELEFETEKYEAFYTSNTITGTIKISKANYTSEDIDITIVIEMEEVEIIPGTFSMPIFYLMTLIIAIAAVCGSLATYRYIQLAKIPEFVKKTRLIKKLIKTNDEIDSSLLYPSKEMYIAHLVKDKWEIIGVPLETVLGIKIQKVEELVKIKPKITTTERPRDLIPKGLILMRWNERVGTEIVVQYPEGIDITKKTLMQIYGTHEYTGESGVVNLMAGNSNILSYYTGADKGYYLVLILHLDDDPDLYEDAMADILRAIFQNLENDSYLHIIPSLFQRLSMFPNLTTEGRIAYVYQDEIKRMIINRLREEGVITKSELAVWLKDHYKEGFFDLENILAELIKMEIIKESSIKGLPSELVFLINDISMIRVPPIEFLKNPETRGLPSQLIKMYSNEINKFFQNYHPSEEDHIKVIETISDPQVYETLRLIRTAIVTRNDLEKLEKKGVSDINFVLKQLWQAEIITVLQDKTGIEYYALLSDFNLDLIFPKYLLKIIKNGYDQKSKGDNVLIEYLNILEDTYMNIKSKGKSE